MKKDFFAFIVALMIVALVGIIGIQVFWLKNAVSIKQAQTDSAINEALSQVIEQIRTKETVNVLTENVSLKDTIVKVIKTQKQDTKPQSKTVQKTQIELRSLDDIDVKSKALEEDLETFIKDISENLNFKIDIKTSNESNEKEKKLEISSSNKALIISKEDERVSIEINRLVNTKKEQVDMVVRQLITEDIMADKPLEQRIDTTELLTDIAQALKNKGISYKSFDLAVIDESNDSVIFAEARTLEALKQTQYKTELFPNDIVEKNLMLYLSVEGTSAQIYKSIMLPLLGSGLFSLIVLLVFIITLVTIHKQKKISDIKSDFINNMTHEFKTPIATIALAADSIENDKVINHQEQVRYFTKIIKEENNRMNYQVENVLQASLLDKDNLVLNLTDTNIEPLIHKAINNIRLQVEKRGGQIQLNLSAKHYHLRVDEVHFINLIYNLLDNANKYSKEAPQITVNTFNKDGFIIISIADKGIGMSKDVKSKIFEKFYRQTHGNVHNVKGFGLGLSYVSSIVSKFKGNISVESKLGEGSTFYLQFPIIK